MYVSVFRVSERVITLMRRGLLICTSASLSLSVSVLCCFLKYYCFLQIDLHTHTLSPSLYYSEGVLLWRDVDDDEQQQPERRAIWGHDADQGVCRRIGVGDSEGGHETAFREVR